MEVVEPVEKPKEVTPEQSQAEKLAQEVVKADKVAHQIKEKVLLPQFTLVKMAELMRITRQEAHQKIGLISRYGYVNSKTLHGVEYFEVLLDPMKRIDSLEQLKQITQAQANGQIEYFTSIQELTQAFIKDAQ